ncbi:MAG: D-aminoacyl-tRNA deacylase [Thermodesulfobacteriota bacterium]
MRLILQRVKEARVIIKEEKVGEIGRGLLVYVGVGKDDTGEDVEYLLEKVLHLRIFPDGGNKFNLSLLDVGGALLVVSQFTLWGDCRKGRRPSFSESAAAEKAQPLYELFIEKGRQKGVPTACGRFQEMMEIHSINDGPVTLLLDSRKNF